MSLARLTTLDIWNSSHLATIDLALPASLTRLTVRDDSADEIANLGWALLEAAKCIRGGAQLRSLAYTNVTEPSHPEGVQWGASLDARYTELGGQLIGLTDLAVYGEGPAFPSAIGSIACSAPSLTRLTFYHTDQMPNGMVLPPICSSSLKSITGLCWLTDRTVPPPPVILTILSGCTQLRDVRVQCAGTSMEGASVKIRCHCNSQRCIVPFEGRAELIAYCLSICRVTRKR